MGNPHPKTKAGVMVGYTSAMHTRCIAPRCSGFSLAPRWPSTDCCYPVLNAAMDTPSCWVSPPFPWESTTEQDIAGHRAQQRNLSRSRRMSEGVKTVKFRRRSNSSDPTQCGSGSDSGHYRMWFHCGLQPRGTRPDLHGDPTPTIRRKGGAEAGWGGARGVVTTYRPQKGAFFWGGGSR